MAWAKRTATDFKDCLQQIYNFVTKPYEAGLAVPNGGNVGTGIIYGTSSSEFGEVETWTITCTTPGGDGVAVFSVVGSVSGAKADATAGVPYSIPEVSFTILTGGVDWSTSNPDSFTIAVTLGTALWTPNDTDFASAQEHILLQGKGTGADEIFVGFRTWTDDATYFNMEVSGFSGYDNTKDYDNQPGKNEAYCCMSSVGFDFHIFMTGRTIKVVSTIGGTIDEHMYAGFFLPVATPAQNGYPMFIGGNSLSSSQLIGQVSTSAHVAYWAENRNKLFNGVAWTSITNFHPLDFMTFNDIKEDLDGNRVVFPATLLATDNVYGDMEGVGYITNSDSAVTTHDFLNAGNVAWLIFQDTTRVGVNRIAAFDLMGDI